MRPTVKRFLVFNFAYLGAMQISIDSSDVKRLKQTNTEQCHTRRESDMDEATLCKYSPEGKCQVSKLFDICVDFIADNLFLVENFINFPDVIGNRIFRAAQSRDMFYNLTNSTHRHSMALFCDAYAEQVLSELNISGKPWITPNLLCVLGIFENVVKLDMSGCRIGDKDNAMTNIAKFSKYGRAFVLCVLFDSHLYCFYLDKDQDHFEVLFTCMDNFQAQQTFGQWWYLKNSHPQ